MNEDRDPLLKSFVDKTNNLLYDKTVSRIISRIEVFIVWIILLIHVEKVEIFFVAPLERLNTRQAGTLQYMCYGTTYQILNTIFRPKIREL